MAPDPDTLARIQAAIAAGRKIEAIKLWRDATGQGLKESKDAVEALEAGRVPEVSGPGSASESPSPAPRRDDRKPVRPGCAGALVLIALPLAAVVGAAAACFP